MKQEIKAWLFDLGKTLMYIPDEYDEEECLNNLLGFQSIDLVRTIIYRLCNSYIGQTYEEFISRFDKEVNKDNDTTISKEIKKIWLRSANEAKLKPYAHEILDLLRESGLKIGLVSNTPPTSYIILEKLNLSSKFDTIIFSCDTGYLKPDPRIFFIFFNNLNVLPNETVIVGDKIRTDILGGAILGMKSILVEERLLNLIDNHQNYVNAIVPNLIEIKNTKLFKCSLHE